MQLVHRKITSKILRNIWDDSNKGIQLECYVFAVKIKAETVTFILNAKKSSVKIMFLNEIVKCCIDKLYRNITDCYFNIYRSKLNALLSFRSHFERIDYLLKCQKPTKETFFAFSVCWGDIWSHNATNTYSVKGLFTCQNLHLFFFESRELCGWSWGISKKKPVTKAR